MPPQKFVALPMIQAFATAAALQKLGHELEQRLNWTTDANGVPVAAPFLAINPPANEQMTVGQYLSSLL
jgi:hypothetical protein